MIFLGVDGGGTKTAFVLIDDKAKILAQHETSTCYYLSTGKKQTENIIQQGISEICKRAGISPHEITYSFLGLPTYGEISTDIEWLDNLPKNILTPGTYQCNNDMICGWSASLGCADGINIVSGTGSISYGENKGKIARCGGWGELFSDEGSAYWIGRHALNVFSKMADGRLKKNVLYDLIKSKHNLLTDLDITDIVFNKWTGERTKIAAVSRIAYEAALQGDIEARTIFFNAAKELALIVDSTRQSLNFKENESILVSYSGGVFNAGELILEPFAHELSRLNGRYHLLEPKFNPNIGAAIYAAKLHGYSFEEHDLQKLSVNEN
jgi:N-acetylglucosamine kinase-like BadF-type ATPase